MADEPPRKYNLRISDADCPIISLRASTIRLPNTDDAYHQEILP